MKSLLLITLSGLMIACAGPGAIGVAYNQKGIVKHVLKNSPAEKAGVKVGDKILNTKKLR